MLTNLTAPENQPVKLNLENIPCIKLSPDLIASLKKMFKEEENDNFCKIGEYTSVVKTDKNYVFFPNQWYCLVASCRKYALALNQYCLFFTNRIKDNEFLMNALSQKDYSKLHELFDNDTDIERMKLFIEGGNDYRPGKCLLNKGKPRSLKDIVKSAILSKINTPAVSSDYLGTIAYYLAQRPALFEKLEIETMSQLDHTIEQPLSDTVKICAKEIIDAIYQIDRFSRIQDLFQINRTTIKLDLNNFELNIPKGNFLRYVFIHPNSSNYDEIPLNNDQRSRVFDDKIYKIKISGKEEDWQLTTEWKDLEPKNGVDGNLLPVLIDIVNKRYQEFIKIAEKKWNKIYFSFKLSIFN